MRINLFLLEELDKEGDMDVGFLIEKYGEEQLNETLQNKIDNLPFFNDKFSTRVSDLQPYVSFNNDLPVLDTRSQYQDEYQELLFQTRYASELKADYLDQTNRWLSTASSNVQRSVLSKQLGFHDIYSYNGKDVRKDEDEVEVRTESEKTPVEVKKEVKIAGQYKFNIIS